MPEFPKMRDLKIGDMVKIDLPAHVWLGFLASYTAAPDYNCAHANTIAGAVQEALVDPLYMKEKRAEAERLATEQQQFMSNMIPGFPGPQIPPDLSGLEGTGEGS